MKQSVKIVDEVEPLDGTAEASQISDTDYTRIQEELTAEIKTFEKIDKQMHQTSFMDYSHFAQRIVDLNKNALKELENKHNKKEKVAWRKTKLEFCYPKTNYEIPSSDLFILIEKKDSPDCLSCVQFKLLFDNAEYTSQPFSLRYPLSSLISMKLPSIPPNATTVSLPPLCIQFYFPRSRTVHKTFLYVFSSFLNLSIL